MLCAPAAAQDATSDRFERLEAKIRALEEELAALKGQAPTAPTAVTETASAPPVNEVATEAEGVRTAERARRTVRVNGINIDADDLPANSLRMPVLDFEEFPVDIFGQIQYDISHISNPGINTVNLGYNGRARRLIFGFRGDLPGDFRYNLEFMLARELVDYEDITLAYEPDGKAFSAKIGFFYPFVSLENLTSNKRNSFVERAQMNDAWALNRRIGASFGLVNNTGRLRFNAGVFNGAINNSSANTEWQFAARGVWAPRLPGIQLHLAAQYQYRQTPAQDPSFLYQARPFTQSTNVRFVGTGPATATGTIPSGIASHGDQIFGAEAAGIFGPLHAVAEAQYVMVDAIRPNEALPTRRVPTGQRLESDPAFWSAYGEIGYFLTGETRGYRNGRFFRVEVLKPVDKGGWGALQIVGRVDHLDLTDRVGGSGRGIVDGVLNGGTQTGYQLAINWWPAEFVRFTTQYSRIQVQGGPSAGQVVPVSSDPLYDRRFGVDAFVARTQFEF